MAVMMGPEWKSLASDHLGMAADDISYVERFHVENEANHQAILLDKYRFTEAAVELGVKLPGHFLEALTKWQGSSDLIQYCQTKIEEI